MRLKSTAAIVGISTQDTYLAIDVKRSTYLPNIINFTFDIKQHQKKHDFKVIGWFLSFDGNFHNKIKCPFEKRQKEIR